MPDAVTKVCSRCGQERPCSEYYSHPNNRDRLQSYCKMCAKESVSSRCKDLRAAKMKEKEDRDPLEFVHPRFLVTMAERKSKQYCKKNPTVEVRGDFAKTETERGSKWVRTM